MQRQSRDILVTEIPGSQYPTLQDAQRAALTATANDLTRIARSLLAAGRLVQRDNHISVHREG